MGRLWGSGKARALCAAELRAEAKARGWLEPHRQWNTGLGGDSQQELCLPRLPLRDPAGVFQAAEHLLLLLWALPGHSLRGAQISHPISSSFWKHSWNTRCPFVVRRCSSAADVGAAGEAELCCIRTKAQRAPGARTAEGLSFLHFCPCLDRLGA